MKYLSVLMVEIRQETGDSLEGDVPWHLEGKVGKLWKVSLKETMYFP